MKVIISIALFLMASTSFAMTTKSDVFNTGVTIKKDSLKCSLIMRSMKMKINGLEDDLGRMGTRYFKSTRRYSDSCKVMIGRLKEKLDNRRGTLDAAVTYEERTERRTVHRGGDNKRGDTMCEETLVKTANIKITQVTLEGMPIQVKREERRSLGSTYGACR